MFSLLHSKRPIPGAQRDADSGDEYDLPSTPIGEKNVTSGVSESRRRPAADVIGNWSPDRQLPWMTNLESRLTQASGSLNSSRTKLLAAIVDNAEDKLLPVFARSRQAL